MNAYIDASVVLRKLLSEPAPLISWKKITKAFASRLLRAEVGRVIDRLRLAAQIDDQDVGQLHSESARLLRTFHLLDVDVEILDLAAGPMPTTLGTLDAIHLVSATVIRRSHEPTIAMATHDHQLSLAATALGFALLP